MKESVKLEPPDRQRNMSFFYFNRVRTWHLFHKIFQGLFKDQIMFFKHIIQTSRIKSWFDSGPHKEFKYIF